MVGAACGGHESIVRLCHSWGATNVDEAMTKAAHYRHKTIVQLCRDEWGATIDSSDSCYSSDSSESSDSSDSSDPSD
jgi:hypothetical protein